MLAAATMGATAFQKGLGATHSIAHPLGVVYDTPHGLANAVLLPYVMMFNRPAIEARMPLLGRVLDLRRADFDGVLDWLLGFRRQLGIPAMLGELQVGLDRAGEIGIMAEHDPSTGTNPRPAKAADMERIFRAAVTGDLAAASG